MKNQADITYDPNISPYYSSNIQINNKDVLVYNMDEHINKEELAKISHIVEYGNIKNECLVTPKIIIENLFLNNDETINEYFTLQKKLRSSVVIAKKIIYFICLILLIYLLANTINYINFSLWINVTVISLLIVSIIIGMFFSQSMLLKANYKSYVNKLAIIYTKEKVINNFQKIVDNIESVDYFDSAQIVITKNHYASLIQLLK